MVPTPMSPLGIAYLCRVCVNVHVCLCARACLCACVWRGRASARLKETMCGVGWSVPVCLCGEGGHQRGSMRRGRGGVERDDVGTWCGVGWGGLRY